MSQDFRLFFQVETVTSFNSRRFRIIELRMYYLSINLNVVIYCGVAINEVKQLTPCVFKPPVLVLWVKTEIGSSLRRANTMFPLQRPVYCKTCINVQHSFRDIYCVDAKYIRDNINHIL